MKRLALCFATFIGLAPDLAYAYHYVTVDAPSPATLATVVSGINNVGLAVGYDILAAPTPTVRPRRSTSFTVNVDGSNFQQIVRPGYVQTSANAIRDDGSIAGISLQATDFGAVGFIRSPGGVYASVDASTGGFPSIFTEATGLNAAGTVVGFFTSVLPPLVGVTPLHGFILQGGTFTQFDVPTASASRRGCSRSTPAVWSQARSRPGRRRRQWAWLPVLPRRASSICRARQALGRRSAASTIMPISSMPTWSTTTPRRWAWTCPGTSYAAGSTPRSRFRAPSRRNRLGSTTPAT